jgi:hypothetical protein
MHLRPIILLLLSAAISCKQVYNPPAVKNNPNFLVIDGLLNGNPGGASTFQLSRTQNLANDSTAYTPELHATLTILGNAGDTWPITEKGNGAYASAAITLSHAEKYQLKIITQDGNQYLSDTVSILDCPNIDSLSWSQDDSSGNVHVAINTHDPANNSHYYRWTFSETWEYESELKSELQLINGRIALAIDSNQNYEIWQCWRSDSSTDILIGNSTKLSQDLISQAPIATIPRGDQKLSVRYSIYANQYVLTPAAYQFWQILENNNQNLGSLFDPQPSQLIGNFHCITNPNQPVIGFLSGSSTKQLRLFIANSQVQNWDTTHTECNTITIPQDPNDLTYYYYPDTLYGPYYYSSSSSLVISKRTCLDCRLQGGTTQKPPFW